MSKLTDFFPSGSTGDKNAILLLVGGGAGSGVNCWGSGGGGVLVGNVAIEAGVAYPVTIGAGGASGNSSPTCYGYPGGKGGNGGTTSFGSYRALGGGSAGHVCMVSCGTVYPFCCTTCPCKLNIVYGSSGGSGGGMFCSCGNFCEAQHLSGYGEARTDGDAMIRYSGSLQVVDKFNFSDAGLAPYATYSVLGRPILSSTPSPTCQIWKSAFFGLCVGNQPYGCNTACSAVCYPAALIGIACSRYNRCNIGCNNYGISPNPNTGHAGCYCCKSGDSGVAIIVYPCPLGAATLSPGAVNCTPVTGPQGYRSYKFTSSGSFTL